MSAFMQPQVEFMAAWLVETSHGSEVVPMDLAGPRATLEDLAPYLEGSIHYSAEPWDGWFCRLSAPGYMDCTDWSGPFDTEVEARLYLADTYDIDPYTGEEATCD